MVAECFVFSLIFHTQKLIKCFEIVAAAPSQVLRNPLYVYVR